MMSAFGVEHVAKSYKKLKPKIEDAFRGEQITRHNTMQERLTYHALVARQQSGNVGHYGRKVYRKSGGKVLQNANALKAPERKAGATGMYAAISRLNRANRVLP